MIPRALVPTFHNPGVHAPGHPSALNAPKPEALGISSDQATINNLTKSNETLKSSLLQAEAKLQQNEEYIADMRGQLEGALATAQDELSNAKVYYADEIERLAKLLSASRIAEESSKDEILTLRNHFSSNAVYGEWKLSRSDEAFKSLPPVQSAAAEAAKLLNDEELAVHMQVTIVFLFYSYFSSVLCLYTICAGHR